MASCLDHGVHRGNPADAPLLAPAIRRIKTLAGRAPRAVTADRGYGEAKVDQELTDLGVSTVVIPRKGKPAKARREHEHGRRFRRLVKWRTGSEGRISYLKRRYGFDRTRLDDLAGAQTWCGLGVLAHNKAGDGVGDRPVRYRSGRVRRDAPAGRGVAGAGVGGGGQQRRRAAAGAAAAGRRRAGARRAREAVSEGPVVRHRAQP